MGQHLTSPGEQIICGTSRALGPAVSWVPWAAAGHVCLNEGFSPGAHLGSLIIAFPALTSFDLSLPPSLAAGSALQGPAVANTFSSALLQLCAKIRTEKK